MPIVLTIGAVIIAVGASAYFFLPEKSTSITNPTDITARVEDVDTQNETSLNTKTSDEPTTSAPSGTYSATATYLTPARTEHIVDISLTLKEGVVSDAVVLFDKKPLGEYSNDNQARFADAYKSEVIGKSLANISLARVGGASLTSRAFNEAVMKISDETTTETTADNAS